MLLLVFSFSHITTRSHFFSSLFLLLEYIRRQDAAAGLLSLTHTHKHTLNTLIPRCFSRSSTSVIKILLLVFSRTHFCITHTHLTLNHTSGFSLFESESLRYPGFVEFDDVNGKVLTYSAAGALDGGGLTLPATLKCIPMSYQAV